MNSQQDMSVYNEIFDTKLSSPREKNNLQVFKIRTFCVFKFYFSLGRYYTYLHVKYSKVTSTSSNGHQNYEISID